MTTFFFIELQQGTFGLGFFFFFLCCVSWILAYSIKDLLVCWRDGFKGHQITNMWNTIPLCLVWCIWNEHNSRSFEGIESLLHLKFIFHRSLLDWLKIIWDFSCSCLWFFDLYKKSFHFSIFMGNHILCQFFSGVVCSCLFYLQLTKSLFVFCRRLEIDCYEDNCQKLQITSSLFSVGK